MSSKKPVNTKGTMGTAGDRGTDRKTLKLNKETLHDLAVPNQSERQVQAGNVRHSEWVGKVWVNC